MIDGGPAALDTIATSAATGADAYRLLQELGLGDGLPVGEPSSPLLTAMLVQLGAAADEVVALVPPLRGPLTARRLAVCAALAGCEPEHLPVLVAACTALVAPELNAFGYLTTTGSAATLLVVNGPARHRLGFNAGANCLGPGNRANATVGRCISLVTRIVGGAREGVADMATMGQPAKLTFCFAENEEASPWAPLHVDRGLSPDASSVTVIGVSGTVEAFAEALAAEDMLEPLAAALVGSAPVMATSPARVGGGQPLVLISPEAATQLARCGYAKADVRRALFERAVLGAGGERELRVADAAEDLMVLVAGGGGAKHTIIPNWNGGSRAVTVKVDLPAT